MATNVTWNNTTYSIPDAGNINWADLSNFLQALGNNAQTTNSQISAVRIATASPVTVVSATDFTVITDLTVPGAVAVTLPAAVDGQIFCIIDGKGDAGTNNITITPDGAETINGAATRVMDGNRQAIVMIGRTGGWSVVADFVTEGGTIPRSQIAAGTADHVVINDGSGVMSSEATLNVSRGGTGADNSAATGIQKYTAGTPSVAEIVDADVSATADITRTKLAAGTADHVMINDGSGEVSSEAQLNAARGGTGLDNSAATGIQKFAAGTPSVGTIVDADIDAAANIDATKLGTGVVNNTELNKLNSAGTAGAGELLTTDGAQVITNKDIDGGAATNGRRITIPKDTKANLDGLTRKEGTIVYASDEDALYIDDGTNLVPVGSGASGSGVKNYVLNSNAEVSATADTTVTNAVIAAETTSPIAGDQSFNVSSSTNNGHANWTLDTIDSFDYQRLLRVSLKTREDSGTPGNWEIGVYNVTDAAFVTGASKAVASGDEQVELQAILASGKTYTIRALHTTTNSDAIIVDDIVLTSEQVVITDQVMTEWETFSDSIQATGTNPTLSSEVSVYRRVGNNFEYQIYVSWSNANKGTGTYYINLPDSLTVDASKIGASNAHLMGYVALFESGGGGFDGQGHVMNVDSAGGLIIYAMDDTTARFKFVDSSTTGTVFLRITGSIPIAEWAGSSTFGANNRVEYISHDGTNIVAGSQGAPIPTGTEPTTFDTYIITSGFANYKATDHFTLQVRMANEGPWLPLPNRFLDDLYYNGSAYIGAGVEWDSTGNNIQLVRGKYRREGSTTWAGLTANTYWRVVKSANPLGIGAGLHDEVTSGAISPDAQTIYGVKTFNDGIAGKSDGSSVTVGNIGEYKEAELTGSFVLTAGTADTWTDDTTYDLVLTAGVWLIGYNVSVQLYRAGSGTSAGNVANCRVYNSTDAAAVDRTISWASSTTYDGTTGTGIDTVFSMNRQSIVNITGTKTFNMSIRRSSSDITTRMFGDSVSGALTNPDNHSVLWALRIG